MTAPAGAIVGIYVDTIARIEPGDEIATTTGRRYAVLEVRIQRRGEHVGRQHLRVLVLSPGAPPAAGTGGRVHRIAWYPRGRR